MTKDLYNLKLLAKLTVLHPKILFSLAIVAIAKAILIRNSAEQVPSLHRVAPRCLKLVPLMLISALMLFVLADGHGLALFSADFHSICSCCV